MPRRFQFSLKMTAFGQEQRMSNTSIAQMMRTACNRWDSGEIDCLQLGEEIYGLAKAIEGRGHAIKDQAEEFCLDITAASESDDPIGEVSSIMTRMRAWIETIG